MSVLKAAGTEPTIFFSHERGFYYNSFELTINSNNSANFLKYTFDGSDPRTSSNAVSVSFPAVINISPHSTDGRAITPAVVIRACAIGPSDTSAVATQTYIFLSEIKYQADVSSAMGPYWPEVAVVPSTYHPDIVDWMKFDVQYIDLGVDAEVVSKPEYFQGFEPAMLSIPSISLATEPDNLFKDSTGIYTNATWHGMEWERPASIEFIYPGGEVVQSDAGLRMRGGFSRMGRSAKHSFRIFFRDEYGNGKFNFPLFEDEGASTFDKFDIKSSQNNSWHMGNANADFVHETFARDIQADMGHPYTRSRFYHLYLNGMYWGIYETQERPEASYAETYFGGDKEDYDVIKSTGPSYDAPAHTLEATDGNLDATSVLWQVAKEGFTDANYFKVLGRNPDGTTNPAYPKLVDEFNLIDYMIFNYYCANMDAPAEINGGTRINNFFGIYNRVNPDGFRFFIHDAETAFQNVNDNITNRPTKAGETLESFNPAWLHQKLMENSIYRQKFADRAYKLFYNNGVLTPNENILRFNQRTQTIYEAIIGESARWGDTGGTGVVPFSKNKSWLPVINGLTNKYFPGRTDIVINQFKEVGWLNNLEPPQIDENDFIPPPDKKQSTIHLLRHEIIRGNTFKLLNNNGTGTIYYSLNNIDPRESNGEISAQALIYSNEIQVPQTLFLMARVKDGDLWSPLTEHIIVVTSIVKMVISEISCNPPQQIIGEDTISSKDLEFIEIKNFCEYDIDLSAYEFSRGIDFIFPFNSIIKSDSLIVLASDSAGFKKVYGFSPFAQFKGNLNNDGEQILVYNSSGNVFLNFNYNAGSIWYEAANGGGYTLVYSDYSNYQSATDKENWKVSANRLGSPGKDDPLAEAYDIKFTEILANSDPPYADAIELYNNSLEDTDISGWYLTDNNIVPDKWKIPENSIIPSKGYLVFYEGHYENDTMKYEANEFGQSFSVSSGGEDLLLFSENESGGTGQFICEYELEPTDKNISFGEYKSVSGNSYQVQLESQFFNQDNTKAYISPVIFKTIMYHPVNGNYEYIILKNRTDSVVNLFHETDSEVSWKIDGIQFTFPPATSLESGDSLYLVEKNVSAAIFKTVMNLDSDVQVFNFNGQLKNRSETISIQKPISLKGDSTNEFAYANEELLTYSDRAPWPVSADGSGYALQRENEELYANDASNWSVLFSVLPVANAGMTQRIRVNKPISLDGSQSSNPAGSYLGYNWNFVSKPGGSSAGLSGATTITPGFTPDVTGKYLLSLEVNNNLYKSVPSYVSVLAYENRAPFALMDKRTVAVNVGSVALLNAARSYDPDYEDLNYTWELLSGPVGSVAQLSSSSSEIAEFIPDKAGQYKLELIVDDGELFSKPYSATVNAALATGLFENTFTGNLLIYPNPVNSILHVDFYLSKPLPIDISIADLNGKILYTGELKDMPAGNNTFTVDLESMDIPDGIYVLQMKSSDGIVSRKIVYNR